MTILDSPSATVSSAQQSTVAVRIAVNCLRVNPSFVGGVTTYVLGLLEGLATEGTGCRFRIFVTTANRHLFDRFAKCENFDFVTIDHQHLSLRTSICRTALLLNNNDIYRLASNIAFGSVQELMEVDSDLVYTPTPVLNCFNSCRPTVLSMHDIQHMHHPEFFTWPVRLSRRITYGLSARHCSYFQASSNYIKEDLMCHFPWLCPDQIEVIASGVLIERFAKPKIDDGRLERYLLPERFLLFPAQLWPHKNHLTVLRALKRIESEWGTRIPLILTGEQYSAGSKVFTFIADQSMDYVRYLGKVPFEDMVALYRRATFMITATLHESSSLPILEAAAAGTPIIASRIPPIEELGQHLKLNLFDPLDIDALAQLIFALWQDDRTACVQAAYNREHISHYSWQNTARKYVQLFNRIVN